MLPTKDISIMIADDEISVLNNTIQKILLCETNFHVIGTANDGLEVLQLLETKIPDILITDIEMPNLNGLDLIRYISTQYPSVHIVILSKSNRFEDIHTAMQLGVKDYLLKPVSQLDLSSVLLKLSEKILQKKKRKMTSEKITRISKNELMQTA